MRVQTALNRRLAALILAGIVSLSSMPAGAFATGGTGSTTDSGPVDSDSPLDSGAFGSLLTDLGDLQISKGANADGGEAEIVKYNPNNHRYYVVDGNDGYLAVVNLTGLTADKSENEDLLAQDGRKTTIQFSNAEDGTRSAAINEIRKTQPDFEYGDLTSVAVDTTRNLVAVSVQDTDYAKNGAVVLLDADGNFVRSFPTGVQPDMVTFSPDGKYILTADEGEPRHGYGAGTTDPEGSVTVVDLSGGLEAASPTVVKFDGFNADKQHLKDSGVILKKTNADPSIDEDPSVDLEPEYIAVAGDKAYVTLQEANSIATLDLSTKTFTSIRGLGFQDYGTVPVDVLQAETDPTDANYLDYKDSAYLETETNLYGIRMPDGVAAVQAADGKTYLLTANEGDSREWGDKTKGTYYCNEYKYAYKSGYKKLTCLLTDPSRDASTAKANGSNYTGYDGNFDPNGHYLFGGRSFSVWDPSATAADGTMKLVYDSKSDFEAITAASKYSAYFNCSNDDATLDSRSNKKGPEPEYVTAGSTPDGKTYAFIGLERIGGVMAYDISDIEHPKAADYLNTRDFSEDTGRDDSPEGLAFVPAEQSPNGYPLLLVANEVSGQVSMMKVGDEAAKPAGALKLAIISDTHLYDDTLGDTGAAFDNYIANDRKMIAASQAILDEALNRIKNSDADYVLISGDLTKDGEKQDHELMAKKLKALEDATGKQVIVIDGNHDLSNKDALSYNGDTTTPVPTIDRTDFKSIYADYGYDLAVAQDPNSLSYSVDLGSEYRLIVMDSAIYNNETDVNTREQQTGGSLTGNNYDPNPRLPWVLGQIEEAKKEGRIPIGMEHHGLVPHTAVQPDFFPDYLLDDYQTVSAELADAGMNLVFTGHFHSQDVASMTSKAGNKLYDMETGSLVTSPCPIRYVTLDGTNVSYTSEAIDSVTELSLSDLNGFSNFDDYKQDYLIQGLIGLVPGMLDQVHPGAGALANMPIGGGMTLAQFLANCMAKHYAGDETPGALAPIIQGLQTSTDPAYGSLYRMLGGAAWALANDTTGDLMNDPNPADLVDHTPDNNGSLVLSAPAAQPSGIVSAFDALAASVKTQSVANGTALSKLNLPGSLNATVDGSEAAIGGVTWTSSPAYAPEAAGTYTFTAVLPAGYTLAGGVSLPAIRVTVAAAENRGSDSNDNSGSSPSSNPPASTTTPSTVTTTAGANGGTTATVSTQPDSAPVVTGNRSSVSVTVPASVASVIASATAASPADVRIAAPTDTLTEQFRNAAVQSVQLNIRVPAAVADNTNANAHVTISADQVVLQAAKDAQKDITLTVTNSDTGREAYSWTFSGAGLNNSVSSVTAVDLALNVAPVASDSSAGTVAAQNASDQKAAGLVLRFADNGLLPGAAQVRVYVGDQANCAPGSKVFLYYLNRTTSALEQLPQSEYAVDANGYVTFSIVHCSDYVLLPQAATHPYPVKSDTTHPVGVQSGRTYTFAFTVTGTAVPSFSVGNGAAFTSQWKRKDNKYFFTVKAVGKSGQMTAVYCTVPGQKPAVMDYIKVA